jgi:hypothetical protein
MIYWYDSEFCVNYAGIIYHLYCCSAVVMNEYWGGGIIVIELGLVAHPIHILVLIINDHDDGNIFYLQNLQKKKLVFVY